MRAIAMVAAAATGMVPVAHQVSPATQEPAIDGPDIVVIARKLRKVRIHYAMRGPFVRSCTTEVSSGDERIDRIMCAILRACVKSGYREVPEAKACMAARVDSLDDAAQAAMLADPGARIAAAPPPPTAPGQPGRAPVAPDGPDIVVTGDNAPDIIVTGDSPTMRGGLWRFRRTATLSFGGEPGGRAMNFTQCLPAGAIEAMLRRAANETGAMPMGQQCGRLRMSFANGRIDGSRSCITGQHQNRLNLTGQYDARRLRLSYNVERDHDGLERATQGAAWMPKRPVGFRWMVTANREGECPLRDRADQLDVNDVVHALFSERGGTAMDRSAH